MTTDLFVHGIAGGRSDRRALLRRSAGLDLALPELALLGPAAAWAQDGHSMAAPATGQAQPSAPYIPIARCIRIGGVPQWYM